MNNFIEIIILFLSFLSNYVIVIDGTCFEFNTYFVYAGNERFPSTNEKSVELCQGMCKSCFVASLISTIHKTTFQQDVKRNVNVLFGSFTSPQEHVTSKLGKKHRYMIRNTFLVRSIAIAMQMKITSSMNHHSLHMQKTSKIAGLIFKTL